MSSITGNAAPTADGVSRIELRGFWWVAVPWLLMLSLPYLWAWAMAPQGYSYGGLLYNVDDQNVHLAWARQAADGHLFFRDLFTSEGLAGNERPLFFNLFATLVGWCSALLHLHPVWPYHIFRLLFGVWTLWCIYRLALLLLPQRRAAPLALALAAWGNGAGWLKPLLPDSIIWMDRPDSSLMMPEAWTFNSALIFPINVLGMALLAAAIWQTEVARRTGRRRALLYAMIAALLLGNIHTYDVLPMDALLLAWAGWSWWQGRRNKFEPTGKLCWQVPLATLLATLPFLLYQVFVFLNSPEFQVKALTKTPAPALTNLLVSYAPLLLPALGGAALLWKRGGSRLATAWMVVTLCAIYSPVSFARKMIEGVHLPVCMLAAAGLWYLLEKLPSRVVRYAAAGGCVVLLSLSSFNFLYWCLQNAAENNMSRANVLSPPVHLSGGDSAAIRYLQDNPAPGAVLCLTFLGNYVPRETGRTVYLGHWAETLHYGRKLEETFQFFGMKPNNNMDGAEAREFLRRNHIDTVIIGSYETAAGAKLPLPLKPAFTSGTTTVYKVDM